MFRNNLVLFQAKALLMLGFIIASLALWSQWAQYTLIFGGLFTVLLAYTGIISWVFLGNRESWVKRIITWAWSTLFSRPLPLFIMCIILLIASLGCSYLLYRAWPIELKIVFRHAGYPIMEKINVRLRSVDLDIDNIYAQQSELILPISRIHQNQVLYVSAHSQTYRTDRETPVNPGNINYVDLTPRLNLLIRVFHSGDTRFVATGIDVGVQNIRDKSTHSDVTDNHGFARFETPPGSMLRIIVQYNNRQYIHPIHIIDSNELHPFEFDLGKDWVTEDITLGKSEFAPILAIELPRQIINATNSSTPYYLSDDISSFDKNILLWAPSTTGVMKRSGYLLNYNEAFKVPNWVAYVIEGQFHNLGRVRFQSDPHIPQSIASSPNDYIGSGFDRGHLVSTADMYFGSQEAVINANYMSAIAPQTRELNQRTWASIEKYGRNLVERYGKVYIFAGSAFINASDGPVTVTFIGNSQIAVPTHFFRIHVVEMEHGIHINSFLVPNTSNLRDDISYYRTSIKEIERHTGLVFFESMSDSWKAKNLDVVFDILDTN